MRAPARSSHPAQVNGVPRGRKAQASVFVSIWSSIGPQIHRHRWASRREWPSNANFLLCHTDKSHLAVTLRSRDGEGVHRLCHRNTTTYVEAHTCMNACERGSYVVTVLSLATMYNTSSLLHKRRFGDGRGNIADVSGPGGGSEKIKTPPIPWLVCHPTHECVGLI